ncbi:hypothetical protein HanHA300_Chr17g0655061 [Helianthus annuus]|nr:hypothetical protein HanHA300_Chr17g0655061 [Helianthus annuus]
MLYPTGKSSSTSGGGESNIHLHDMLPLCLKIDFLNMNFNAQTNSKRERETLEFEQERKTGRIPHIGQPSLVGFRFLQPL